MSDNSDLVKKRQSVLDVGQRNQLESVQTELRRNNECLTTLRRENKELRLALQQSLRGQRNVSIEDHYTKEEELLHNKMCVLKRSLNAVRGKNEELAKEIERTKEENTFVAEEGTAAMVDENSAVAKKIRALENRLDKCLIKHNEVNAIRRTYETLLERLQLEQAGFDVQLTSTEKALQSTERELQELNEVGKEAAKGRDDAKASISALRATLAQDRRTQGKDLAQRREFIAEKRDALERKHNTLLVKMAQQEERHAKALLAATGGGAGAGGRRRQQDGGEKNAAAAFLASLTPPEVEELRRQREAYLRLRDATMSNNVTDALRKILERRESSQQLHQTAEDLQAAVQESTARRDALQEAWDAVHQKSGGAMATAKVTRRARDRCLAEEQQRGTDDDDDDDDDGVSAPTDDAGQAAALSKGPSAGGHGKRGPDYGLLASRARQSRSVLEDFNVHLHDRATQLQEAQKEQDSLTQLLTDTESGVKHLAEKLSVLRAADQASDSNRHAHSFAALVATQPLGSAAIAAATDTMDLLRGCDTKLQAMLEEVTPSEVEAIAKAVSTARVAVPANNVRIGGLAGSAVAGGTTATAAAAAAAAGAHAGDAAEDGVDTDASDDDDAEAGSSGGAAMAAVAGPAAAAAEEFPDSEIHGRLELKMMSRATVEREETKRMRKRNTTHRADDAD